MVPKMLLLYAPYRWICLLTLSVVFAFLLRGGAQNAYSPEGWTEITEENQGIKVCLKYATEDNFTNIKLYACGRCYLRKEVASALIQAQRKLEKNGYGLLVWDCYRPLAVQYAMWEITPAPRYVANPSKGSMHNRGAAVDLTVVDGHGHPLDMGSEYDYFGREAHWSFRPLSREVLQNRRVLLEAMHEVGLQPIKTEWWHFSMRNLPNSKLHTWEWPCK